MCRISCKSVFNYLSRGGFFACCTHCHGQCHSPHKTEWNSNIFQLESVVVVCWLSRRQSKTKKKKLNNKQQTTTKQVTQIYKLQTFFRDQDNFFFIFISFRESEAAAEANNTKRKRRKERENELAVFLVMRRRAREEEFKDCILSTFFHFILSFSLSHFQSLNAMQKKNSQTKRFFTRFLSCFHHFTRLDIIILWKIRSNFNSVKL